MLLYRFARFLFVRPSVRSSVRPPILSSVRQFECKFLSLMHVCMSVIFIIFNSKFLASNFDIYSRVCMLAYESVRPICARIWTDRLSLYTPGWPPVVWCQVFVSVRPCIWPPICMHMWKYVRLSILLSTLLYASMKFYISVCTWVSVGVGIIVCLSVLFDLLSAYPIK